MYTYKYIYIYRTAESAAVIFIISHLPFHRVSSGRRRDRGPEPSRKPKAPQKVVVSEYDICRTIVRCCAGEAAIGTRDEIDGATAG